MVGTKREEEREVRGGEEERARGGVKGGMSMSMVGSEEEGGVRIQEGGHQHGSSREFICHEQRQQQ